MASEVVQFRQDSADLEYLRARGLNPNEAGRLAFQALLRKLRAGENIEKLRALQTAIQRRATRPFSDIPIQDAIRRDRDAR